MRLRKQIILLAEILFILILITGQGQANQNLREMDFAYGRRIQLGGDSPLYRFFVDGHVYRNVVNKQLVDLRVFNSQKETVPLQIRRVNVASPRELTQQKLPIFPLYAEKDQESGDITLNFESNGKQIVLKLERSESKVSLKGVSGFLVDLGEEKQIPQQLIVDLNFPQSEYQLAVNVSGSDDLNDWNDIVPSAALVKMKYNGQQLSRKHINLPPFSHRYLRLLFQTPFKGQLPANIIGVLPKVGFRYAPKTTNVKGTHISDKPEMYTYNSRGFFPVEQIQLRLPAVNTMIKARISSRENKRQPWRRRATAVFYRLKIDGAELENPPVTIEMNQDSRYRIEILAGSFPRKDAAPELLLMWYPHECDFLASGDPPFMLAYGNADLISEAQVIDDLLEAIGQKNQKTYLGFSRLELPQVLGGTDRLEPSGYTRESSLRYVLWLVLLLSIIGLAAMARQLYQQVKN